MRGRGLGMTGVVSVWVVSLCFCFCFLFALLACFVCFVRGLFCLRVDDASLALVAECRFRGFGEFRG